MNENININVSGPVQPTSTYKTKILKGNHSFASQVTESNMKYVIKYNFELDDNVTIPENCVLEFDGGSINGNSILTLNNVEIKGNGLLCNLSGKTKNAITPRTCGAIGDGVTDDSVAFLKAITCGNSLIVDGTYLVSQQIELPVGATLTGLGKSSSNIITNGIIFTNSNTIHDLTLKTVDANTPYLLYADNNHIIDVLMDVQIYNVDFVGQPFEEGNSNTTMIKIVVDSNPENRGLTGIFKIYVHNCNQNGILKYGVEEVSHFSTNSPVYHPWGGINISNCFFAWVKKTIYIHNSFAEGVSYTPTGFNCGIGASNVESQYRSLSTIFPTEHFIWIENSKCSFNNCNCTDTPSSIPAVYANNEYIFLNEYLNDGQSLPNNFLKINGISDCSLENILDRFVFKYTNSSFGHQVDYGIGKSIRYDDDENPGYVRNTYPLGSFASIGGVEGGKTVPHGLIGIRLLVAFGNKIFAIGSDMIGRPCVSNYDLTLGKHNLKYIYSDVYMPRGNYSDLPNKNIKGGMFYREDLGINQFVGIPTWCYLDNGDASRYTDAFGFYPVRKQGGKQSRPTPSASIDAGTLYFDTDLKRWLVYYNSAWRNPDGSLADTERAGTTSERPTAPYIYVGFQYYDTDLHKPIWVDAISGNTITWVDATGTPV